MPKPLPPALVAWLRRAREPFWRHPARTHLLLSGSTLIAALCPGARTPRNLDYVWGGRFDHNTTDEVLNAAAALLDAAPLRLLEKELIEDDENAFPDARLLAVFEPKDGESTELFVNFTFNDPLTQEPRLVDIAGVGPTMAVAPESLFAWKTHALAYFVAWSWRLTDLYDLRVLWAEGGLERAALPAALDVAFSSRGSALDELDEFRFDDTWGMSQSRANQWGLFLRENQLDADFLSLRAEMRAALDGLLPQAQEPPRRP